MKLTYNEQMVVGFLDGRDFTPPTKIGCSCGRNYSAWASPICLRLVKKGVLLRSDKGHYKLATCECEHSTTNSDGICTNCQRPVK